jgi:outer membrane protein assembly factor BamB
MNDTHETSPRKLLRLWPGVAAAVLLLVVRVLVPAVAPKAQFFGVDAAVVALLGGLVCALAIVLWWLFFSRAAWSERLGVVVLMIVALFATERVVDESIRGGHMGWMLPIYGIKVLSLALVVWAVASHRLAAGPRRAAMVGAILLACGLMASVRTGGISGDAYPDLHWRWSETPEERLLAQERDSRAALPSAPVSATTSPNPIAAASERPVISTAAKPVVTSAAEAPTTFSSDPADAKQIAEWPGFRGRRRDSVIRGVRIDTDWAASPPIALWRRPIGPGWSSFAVDGDLVYTQEQRGEEEIVSCYQLSTGEPIWRHRDSARFYESNGGAGPRGTPTVHNGRVYAMGATGIVNALNATTGAVIWSRNAATDTGAPIPGWGYTASPLVVNDAVIAATSGRLVSYDIATGSPLWTHTTGGGGYSSPHFVTIDGVAQILLLAGNGATSVAPADGTRLWQHSWNVGTAIVQPGLAGEHDVLIGLGDAMGGQGMRRLALARGPAGWTVEERWTSRGLKPNFNDSVVHEGHAYGFDGNILSSINLADGERKWKGGRYGNGQMLLLADQDLLLVLSEDGELALVSATPDKFTEVARAPAIEGKTWNHPVLVGDVLLVRNGQEMAAFRLQLASR